MATDNIILDIDTTKDTRAKVRINGRLYAIRKAEELSILGSRGAFTKFSELAPLLTLAKPTEEQDRALSELLDEVCRMVLDAPSKVHEQLNDQDKLNIINSFSLLLPGMPKAGAKRLPTRRRTPRSTGARRSRG